MEFDSIKHKNQLFILNLKTNKITINELKKLIKEELQKEGFYFPVSNEVYGDLKNCMREVLYPHGSEEPLSKEQFMDTVSRLAETIYNEMT